jgi:hypothetical protein
LVTLGKQRVTDADLVHLKSLPNITELILNYTAITDAGLAHLKPLENLRELWLLRTSPMMAWLT